MRLSVLKEKGTRHLNRKKILFLYTLRQGVYLTQNNGPSAMSICSSRIKDSRALYLNKCKFLLLLFTIRIVFYSIILSFLTYSIV